MPPAAAPAGNNNNNGGGGFGWVGTIVQWALIYFLFTSMFGGKKEPAVPITTTTTTPGPDGQPIATPVPASIPYYSFFPRGTLLDLRVLLSEDEHIDPKSFSDYPSSSRSPVSLPCIAWSERRISLDSSDSNIRESYVEIKPTQTILNNGTVFAHVYLTKTGENEPSPDNTFSATFRINRYKHRRLYKETKNLLSGELRPPSEHESTTGVVDIISYWAPNLTLNVVDDFTQYPRNAIPEPLRPFFKFHPKGDAYYPILFQNSFWLLADAYYPLNDTLSTLPLMMQYNPISLWKLMLYTQMEQSFALQQNTMGVAEGETDEFKRVLLDTNPWVLGLTVCVSLLHSVFDFLAFKNDITFWKNRENIEGLSVRTIFLNTICQLIIFLYLLDNETSFMILISVGIGVIIEFWKISKACSVTITWRSGIPTWINFADRQSYTQSRTKEYDDLAFKYLAWALYPLLIGYAIYSLYYDTHKGWYSWILSSLTGAVYTFGFIMMTPQLFINYKLKSVAHLPWRVFAYKALNTFIDDLFAFIIKMPTMHRLACLRDDLVFFVYLYQRWIYPVDKARVNEFGMSGEDAERIAAGQQPAAGDATPATATITDGSAAVEDTAVAAPRPSKKKSKPAVAATESTATTDASATEDKKRK